MQATCVNGFEGHLCAPEGFFCIKIQPWMTMVRVALQPWQSPGQNAGYPLHQQYHEQQESLMSFTWTSQVIQPATFAVGDKNKLIDEGVTGTPDFIIGILSPSTTTTLVAGVFVVKR
jgi:hypothetical protein